MITLRYRATDLGESNTFTVTQDGPVLSLHARVKRNDATNPVDVVILAYASGRTVPRPSSSLPLARAIRIEECAWHLYRVAIGHGILPESLSLVGVPGSVGDAWAAPPMAA